VGRSGQGEADDPDDDRPHRGDLPPPHALVQQPRGHRQEHHEADGQSRLHHRERREEERKGLSDPSREDENRAADPDGTGRETGEEGGAEPVLDGDRARLQRLHRQPRIEEDGRDGGEEDAEEERGHGG
jgi:hypothetical protein